MVTCKNCGNEFNKLNHNINRTKSNFCSISCSVSYNNRLRSKIKPKLICPNCKQYKTNNAKTCIRCKIKLTLDKQLNRTLKDATYNGNARVKWSHVRDLARRVLEFHNIPKVCSICGFDVVVEIHHIKPVSSFSPQIKLKIINSLENLVYLCPNHHAIKKFKLSPRGFEPLSQG